MNRGETTLRFVFRSLSNSEHAFVWWGPTVIPAAHFWPCSVSREIFALLPSSASSSSPAHRLFCLFLGSEKIKLKKKRLLNVFHRSPLANKWVEDKLKTWNQRASCSHVSVYVYHFNTTSRTINDPCWTGRSCKWIKALSWCQSPTAAQIFVDDVPTQEVTEHGGPQLEWRFCF